MVHDKIFRFGIPVFAVKATFHIVFVLYLVREFM